MQEKWGNSGSVREVGVSGSVREVGSQCKRSGDTVGVRGSVREVGSQCKRNRGSITSGWKEEESCTSE